MNRQELLELIDKYLTGKASKEETDRFFYLLEQPEYQDEFHAVLEEQYRQGLFDTEPNEKLRQLIQARLHASIQKETPEKQKAVVRRMPWKWVAAASIILVIAAAVVGILTNNHQGTTTEQVAKTNDVPAPKETRAVITLADGRKVYLDSAGNGTLAQENNVNIIRNKEGEILYMSPAGGGRLNDVPNDKRPGVVYNTLFNPRGSKVVSLTLSDGTKVWLNSESSLRYPASFASTAFREVEITGEAYFEVTHDATKPFHVKKGETDVTVLGTHFNVNAYDDEDALRVTLLEGSVNVSNNAGSVKIKPGQQAELTRNTQPVTHNNIDVDEVISWKNGRFELGGSTIEPIMRQVARWYDVSIEYKANITQHFGGSVSRSASISEVLKALEATGSVKFKIEGKKIIVMTP
jgi:ferric-dicitrate binding protein FerR (iron transport regulator)